jgi:thiol-disulfide isomerase/thioredoxin
MGLSWAGKKTRLLLIALAFGSAGILSRQFLAPAEPLIAAPEIRSAAFWSTELPDLARQPQKLEQWLGKVVVVNFWAPWCPPCRKEIPGFIALQKQYGERGLQFVGIALDQDDPVRAYVAQAGFNYPILLGAEAAFQLSQAAGNPAGGLPYTVVFDRQGNAIAGITGVVSQTRLEGLLRPLL